MIFEPAQRVSLPTKDLLSYTFDNPRYDQDEPVRSLYLENIDQLADFEIDICRCWQPVAVDFL